jgi:hypothetical protein
MRLSGTDWRGEERQRLGGTGLNGEEVEEEADMRESSSRETESDGIRCMQRTAMRLEWSRLPSCGPQALVARGLLAGCSRAAPPLTRARWMPLMHVFWPANHARGLPSIAVARLTTKADIFSEGIACHACSGRLLST